MSDFSSCTYEPRMLGAVPVDVCMETGAGVVEQRHLFPLVQGAMKALPEKFDTQVPPRPAPNAPPCPRCGGAMGAFGYQGAHAVMLHRCPSCAIVWIAPGQIDRMARMAARTSGRRREDLERMAEASRLRGQQMTDMDGLE